MGHPYNSHKKIFFMTQRIGTYKKIAKIFSNFLYHMNCDSALGEKSFLYARLKNETYYVTGYGIRL